MTQQNYCKFLARLCSICMTWCCLFVNNRKQHRRLKAFFDDTCLALDYPVTVSSWYAHLRRLAAHQSTILPPPPPNNNNNKPNIIIGLRFLCLESDYLLFIQKLWLNFLSLFFWPSDPITTIHKTLESITLAVIHHIERCFPTCNVSFVDASIARRCVDGPALPNEIDALRALLAPRAASWNS